MSMVSTTSAARERILTRIRARSGNGGTTSEVELAAIREEMAPHRRGPLPAFARQDPVERFLHECDRLKTTAECIDGEDGIAPAVARYLDRQGLEKRVVAWESFAALDWPGAGVVCDTRLATGADLVGLTDCFCAIGETGTLLLLSSPQTPKVHALLPETHLCVVRRPRIVPTMEDAFSLVRAERGALPRATFFVSGPSRTADIEQTIVIGAHGPYRVHVIVVP